MLDKGDENGVVKEGDYAVERSGTFMWTWWSYDVEKEKEEGMMMWKEEINEEGYV